MLLQQNLIDGACVWSVDGRQLARDTDLSTLLGQSRQAMLRQLAEEPSAPLPPNAVVQAPVDRHQEVWGSGVTYMRSREARESESAAADVYGAVYDAARPEIFFKAQGWRTRGSGEGVRIRRDSDWNVPEPELTLVVNAEGEIVGYTVGNDMSSRDIEGANPLYLPQAKTYNGSCAVGPAIHLCDADELVGLEIDMRIERNGDAVFEGSTSTSNMKRTFPELAEYLCRELDFPAGALLMTGTGIVPPDEFTLLSGDVITIRIGDLSLVNTVE
ncbi:MAG: fumarylacetoacetate hydrolase [Caldilineaceae bacterium SB0665_bin_21]|nr:fumarylacetoacetate hydrolase [Caldilineaceae bacterium SB0665_bin_21]MYC61717.1 fumarylacetoacetate hydrolase [Caldilineaceae bacterium SB0661_bin_34]